MVAVKSKKPLLSTRVSWEVYDRVVALTKGEKPQFESISDYLTATIPTTWGPCLPLPFPPPREP